MVIQSASLTIITHKLSETRKFYEAHFGARPVFDCGWFISAESAHQDLLHDRPENPKIGFRPHKRSDS